MLAAGHKAGKIKIERGTGRGRPRLYSLDDPNADWDFQLAFEGPKGWDDKRLRPRLGKVPVDVEKELSGIFVALGRPAAIEEVIAAWGQLRERRKHESTAGDMAALIAAKRKREIRAAKRKATVL